MSNKNNNQEVKEVETKEMDLEQATEIEELKLVIEQKNSEIEELEITVKELEGALSASGSKLQAAKDSSIILDPKKLNKNKKYVSGPNGIGFVESK